MIQYGSRFARDGVDDFKVPCSLPFKGIKLRVLQSHRRLRGEQRQQVDGLFVEMIKILALAVENAHHLVSHHQRHRKLGLGIAGRRNILWMLRHIRCIDRTLLSGGGPGQSLTNGQAHRFVPGVPANLASRMQFLFLFVQQQDRHVLQMEIVAGNRQDLPEDLVEVEGRQNSLACVVKDGDLVHSLEGF